MTCVASSADAAERVTTANDVWPEIALGTKAKRRLHDRQNLGDTDRPEERNRAQNLSRLSQAREMCPKMCPTRVRIASEWRHGRNTSFREALRLNNLAEGW